MCRGYTVPFQKNSSPAAEEPDMLGEMTFVPCATKKSATACSTSPAAFKEEMNNTISDAPTAHCHDDQHYLHQNPSIDREEVRHFSTGNSKVVLPPLAFLKVPPKAAVPRADIDMETQKAILRQERMQRRGEIAKHDRSLSMYGSLSPPEEDRVMVYCKHALRQLVITARERQITNNSGSTPVSPSSSSSSLHNSHHAPQRQHQRDPPMDLTNAQNFRGVLRDIDTLMTVAQSKAQYTQERIVCQTYEQLSRFRLWASSIEHPEVTARTYY